MKKINRALAAFLAAILIITLFGCADKSGEQQNSASDTGEAQTDAPDITSDNPQSVQGSLDPLPGDTVPEEDADAAFIGLTERLGIKVESSEKIQEEDYEKDYGAVRSVSYELENSDSVIITEFKSEEDSLELAQRFNEGGDIFSTNEGGSVILCYIAPIHMWRSGKYIVRYFSETGEYLWDMNEIFGTEFAGVGKNYFRPDYVEELIDAVYNAGSNTVICERSKEMQQLYIAEPESMCMLTADNGDVIYVRRYSDESVAMDHAARFSPDGRTYTGFNGQNGVTIELDHKYPLHLFKKGNIVVEYSAEDPVFLDAITSVYGYQFAGEDYESAQAAANYDISYSSAFIRTNCMSSQIKFPQFVIIRSKQELDSYYNEHKDIFDLERRDKVYADTTIGWLDQADKYDKEWFDTHDLVLAVLSEGSGSNRHEVMDFVRTSERDFRLTIKRIVPEVGTDDMAEWHLFLEVEGKILNPLDNVGIVFAD